MSSQHQTTTDDQAASDVEAVLNALAALEEHADELAREARIARQAVTEAKEAIRQERAWAIPGLAPATVERLSGWGGWSEDVFHTTED